MIVPKKRVLARGAAGERYTGKETHPRRTVSLYRIGSQNLQVKTRLSASDLKTSC